MPAFQVRKGLGDHQVRSSDISTYGKKSKTTHPGSTVVEPGKEC